MTIISITTDFLELIGSKKFTPHHIYYTLPIPVDVKFHVRTVKET